jgi:hypothetical protein
VIRHHGQNTSAARKRELRFGANRNATHRGGLGHTVRVRSVSKRAWRYNIGVGVHLGWMHLEFQRNTHNPYRSHYPIISTDSPPYSLHLPTVGRLLPANRKLLSRECKSDSACDTPSHWTAPRPDTLRLRTNRIQISTGHNKPKVARGIKHPP